MKRVKAATAMTETPAAAAAAAAAAALGVLKMRKGLEARVAAVRSLLPLFLETAVVMIPGEAC